MTESVIIYRNRTEQAFDQALYDNGLIAWIIPILGAVIAGIIVATLVDWTIRKLPRRTPWFVREYGAGIAGIVGTIAAFVLIAKPLFN